MYIHIRIYMISIDLCGAHDHWETMRRFSINFSFIIFFFIFFLLFKLWSLCCKVLLFANQPLDGISIKRSWSSRG